MEDEFYLKIEVSDDIVIDLTTAEDEFNESKKTLFATYVWTGSTLLAKELCLLADRIASSSIVEFGAAAGLPSIVAARLGARLVCATDYPSPSVLEALEKNVAKNGVQGIVTIQDHIWGEDVGNLLRINNGAQYDFVLAAECLWRHESHQALLSSILGVLKPEGELILTYSHHIPGLEQEDDQFLHLCDHSGLAVVDRKVLNGKAMWSDGMKDIYLCRLKRKTEF